MEAMQRNIIDTLGVTADIDPSSEIQRRVDFLASYLESVPGAKGFVLGISGGQDSTLAGKLAQLAVEQARQSGRDAEFVAVRLPYSVQRDEDDAQLALSFIGADHVMTVNIASAVDALADELNDAFSASQLDSRVTDFNKGNIKARMRMVAQYGIAGERGLLVIGTDHAAEAVTGFFTKFGDGAADVVPLAGLTKSQGAAMLEHLGADPRLWQKVPTADLLDEDPGQSDEESLGVSYAEIDRYLTGGTISEDAQRSLEQKYRASEHKRRLPVSVSDTWWQRSETFVLAGGCFWCLDTAYRALDGVLEVVSAYTGGHTPNPSYEQVCTGATGHAEAVAVKFDPSVIPAEVILDAFFTMHNPTQLNRQGNDVGTQYRSAMFYSGKEQRVLFEAALQRAQTWWPEPIVTTLEPLGELFPAEDYHQDFFAKNPTQGYCLAVAVPKVNKIRQTFTKYLK